MTALQDNLLEAEHRRQIEQASGNFTNAQVAIRYQRRRLWAE
jgi:hypothetical protein